MNDTTLYAVGKDTIAEIGYGGLLAIFRTKKDAETFAEKTGMEVKEITCKNNRFNHE